jgi:hypothetical protein
VFLPGFSTAEQVTQFSAAASWIVRTLEKIGMVDIDSRLVAAPPSR